jgi:hypothetical protein
MNEIIILPPQTHGGIVVYATDFGFSTEATDNAEALRRALAHCKDTGAEKLCLAPRCYRMKNQDFILLDGFEDFTLDGCGAELLSETSYFFLMQNCSRVMVENITMDFDWEIYRPASLIRVLDQKDRVLTVEFLNCEAPESCDICSFNRFDPQRLTPGVEDGLEIWVHNENLSDFRPGDAPNSLTFRCNEPHVAKMRPGEIYLARHMRQRRGCNLFMVDCTHMTMKNNTIYCNLGMTHMVGGLSHHILFDGEVIKVRPNSERYISVDGDGIHIIRSKGHIVIQNCDFSGMGDDSVNIHDCNYFVLKKTAADTVLLENEGAGVPGDLFDLRAPDFAPTGMVLTLKQLIRHENGAYSLQFLETLPDWVGEGCMLTCRSFRSDHYIIRNNYFHDHRARGLLLQASHGLVEHNRLENIQGAGIFVMLEILRGLWYEGSGVEDLTIRNNIFQNCNCGTWTSTIDLMAVLPDNTSEYKTFRQVVISDNEIITTKAPVAYISNSEGVTFGNNRITFTGGPSGYAPVYKERSSHCIFPGNTIDGRPMIREDVKESNSTVSRRCMPLYAHLY